MCGIVAIINQHTNSRRSNINKALDTLILRGPDDYGVWHDDGISIGHRRLSVMGKQNGRQPITSEDGNIIIAVNGEFYGYKDIRRRFASSYHFSTDSDSEILIPLYLEYGHINMMEYLRGEFAFVLYDKRKKLTVAVRDRFGIKPLCWYKDKNNIIFASKAKAIIAAGIHPQWDEMSLMQSISMHYQPTDRTYFKDIHQVAPGHMILVDHQHSTTCDITYWDINYPQEQTLRKNTISKIQEKKWIDEFHNILHEAISLRLVSDSKVCCHLSGGLDSSTIAGMSSKITGKPLHCFSIVFPDIPDEYNEEPLAQETVRLNGGVLHKIEVRQTDILKHLPEAVYHSEGIAVNGHLSCKYLLNKAIRNEGFKVALTGEGADECLAGYPHLRKDLFAMLPSNEYETLSKRLYATNLAITGTEIPVGDILDCDTMHRRIGHVPAFLQAKASIGYKMYSLLSNDMLSQCKQYDFIGGLLDKYDINRLIIGRHKVNQSLYLWNKLTLCNYILATLGDGCEMGASVEGRLPFLDHKLFEFAAQLPIEMKIKDFTNEKYILKEAAKPYISYNVYARQKHPFQSPPLTRFFTKELITQIHDEFCSTNFTNMGVFDSMAVESLITKIPKMSVIEQTIYEPVVMLMLTIHYMNKTLMKP